MDRILNYLFLQMCTAVADRDFHLTDWYQQSWQWLEKFYDESKETSQQMAQGTQSDLRQAEHSLVRTVR